MGCCLSTTAVNKSNRPDSQKSQLNPGDAPPSLSPPPVLEEETVKEVLTETPIPKPPTPTQIDSQPNKQPPQIHQVKMEPEVTTKPAVEIFSEVSEVSELCSYTESYSTTALTEKRDDDDDDGEVTQRVNRPPAKVPRKRQYAGEHLRGKERGVRPPARRSVPSPERKGPLPSRSVPGRNTTAQRRIAGPPNVVRRDTGEGSGRRSRSPAIRGEFGQRRNIRHSSPSLSKADRSSGTPAVGNVENEGNKLDKPDDGAVPEPRESLDNPLVSLECFIFL